VTERMTEHYSHVDVGEKKAAVEGMLRLMKGGVSGGTSSGSGHVQGGPKQAVS